MMNTMQKNERIVLCIVLIVLSGNCIAADSLAHTLNRLKQAYPQQIQSVNEQSIVWMDGTQMKIGDTHPHQSEEDILAHPTLADQLAQSNYPAGMPPSIASFQPSDDPGRIRFDPFFRKMYGNSASEVQHHLTTIYWMPALFGHDYPLRVTRVNDVDIKLARVSSELETLVLKHPEYLKYLENPSGLYNWRVIANTSRLSPHSFGIAFDLNIAYTNYWQWELQKRGIPVRESAPLIYKNRIPWEIVLIFEKNGFIWGGKWRHYDTMHFEYRPELLPE